MTENKILKFAEIRYNNNNNNNNKNNDNNNNNFGELS
jgi:hypothetical protein